MFKIPFSWMPGSWGLKGKTRAIAQAEYELTGSALQQKLIELNYADDPKQLAIKLLDLKRSTGSIDEYEYDLDTAKLGEFSDKVSKDLSILDIDLKYEKITQVEYDKQRAELLKEPWVSMPKIHWDPILNGKTYFELDYNSYFLEFLRTNGYDGEDDDIINKWLNDICISISEEISGIDGDMVTPSRRST